MEIASGLREQFHSHTVSKQEKHHYDVVKFVMLQTFIAFLLYDLNGNITNDMNLLKSCEIVQQYLCRSLY